MLRITSVACLFMVAGCAALSSTDPNAVPAAELQSMISGRTVKIGTETATYSTAGRYTYKGANPGTYNVTNGMICVNFDRGDTRCDQVLRSGKGFVFVTGTGDRVPFRPL